ncbi:MAG: LysR family transcriptional regulator [Gammaproteobacteria bacterium]|nr:LysR family transcriptional regulator [Gammaproteobacteria bacterium]
MSEPNAEALRVFAQVVESGSFSSAARHLGLTTSAVSRQVSRLERELGARLLNRTTRSLSPTELGREVHAGARQVGEILRALRSLAGAQAGEARGLLRLSAPVVFGQAWLAPRLPGFLDRFPGIGLELSLTDRMVDLAEEGIDLALRITRQPAPGWIARPLMAVRYVLVASPAYLERRGLPERPEALTEHACLHLGYGEFGGEWSLYRGEERVAVSVCTRLRINNSAALVAAAQAGAGLALVPQFAAEAALARGELCPVLGDWRFEPPYAATVHAVWLPGKHMPLKLRAFLDHFAAEGSA